MDATFATIVGENVPLLEPRRRRRCSTRRPTSSAARIPLLVALGFHLDDKIPIAIHQRRRDGTGDEGWGFDAGATPTSFEIRRLADGGDPTRVGLAVSLTAPIGDDAAGAANDATLYEVHPADRRPSRDVLTARAALDAFADTYHAFLETVESEHPACREIMLFVAAPVAAAIQSGRGVMRDLHPVLSVFERDGGGAFIPALRLA